MEATTTPVEEKATETTTTSSEEVKEASSNEATTAVSTYQPEETKTTSATYAAPAAPDYAGLAVAKSENAGLQPQTAALKKKLPTCLVSHPLWLPSRGQWRSRKRFGYRLYGTRKLRTRG